MRLALVVALSACMGCTPRSTGSSAGADASAPPPPSTEQAAMKKACAGTCGGPLAQLTVYRDASGAAKRFELNGSPSTCSHPPTVFFDESGTQTAAIPMVPVVPGSDQAKGFAKIRENETAGLTRGGEVSCGSLAK